MKITRKTNPALKKALDEINKRKLSVGWFENLKYEDTGESVAQIAAQNEFGVVSKNIPPRPFMRNAISKDGMVWTKNISQALKKSLDGGNSTVLLNEFSVLLDVV